MAELPELDKHGGQAFNPSLDVFTRLVSTELTLHADAYNFSAGTTEGMGPRYGASTIPGQADSEAMSGTRYPGLRASEGSPSRGFFSRAKVLAVVPMSLGTIAAPATKVDTYVWVLTDVIAGEKISVQVATTTAATSAEISAGFAQPTSQLTAVANYDWLMLEALPAQSASRVNTAAKALNYATSKFYASTAVLTVSGQNIPMRWYVGEAITAGDATHAPDIALHKCTTLETFAATPGTICMGVPSQFNLQNYSVAARNLNIFTFDANGDLNCQYVVLVSPSSSTFKRDVTGAKTRNLDIDSIVATRLVAGVPASTVAALVEDGQNVHSSAYKAVLVAAGAPYATIFQDIYTSQDVVASETIYRQQVVDLTHTSYEPPSINPTTAGYYAEDGSNKISPFQYWPAFVRGTEMTNFNGVTNFATLGGANTGILRKNTVYEFTYAVFNKRLGFETNVCPNPVKIQVGSVNDFQSLVLYNSAGAPGGHSTIFAFWGQLQLAFLPFFFSNNAVGSSYTGTKQFLNFYEYRFYFRQEGMFEWLPALQIDAAKFWFFPHTKLSACTIDSLGGLPGGQPGGIADNSPLPNDTYNCVVTYKDRAFWFAEGGAIFSRRNNIFSYPLVHSISMQGGKFRGAKVHNYPGQAQQGARLLVVADTGIYVGRFTGQLQTQYVQISTASDPQPALVDGSDFVLDEWTSNTAFSHRSLCIADGIAYWWGPDGVFRDDGVATPPKISWNLEPDIFGWYDPNKTEDIHSVYNAQTKEIFWFYAPKVADGFRTHALVFNTASDQFYPAKFVGVIDAAALLEVKTAIGTAGKRAIIMGRSDAGSSVQRAYFFDQRNRAGDIYPTTDMVVKQISTPSAGLRRLTLAAGFDATNFATIVAGDSIALHQVTSYASAATGASNIVAAVAATNTGAGTIDIVLPSGATLPNTSMTFDTYFPIWHRAKAAAGLNGITYRGKLNYWTPWGLAYAALWLYMHFVFRLTLWKSTRAPTTTETYRTPVSTETASDELTFVNNADGYCEILHGHQLGERAIEGQGLQWELSGFHIGHEWVLESVTAYTSGQDINHLKEFEG